MKSIVRSLGLGVVVGLGSVVGCAHRDSPDVSQAPARTGKLELALEAVSASGKIYRLRNAIFDVQGLFASTQKELRSEDDPSGAVLETFLAPSNYFVILQSGWFMEQVDQLLGTTAVVPATLVSSFFQQFDIRSNEETFVRFDFQVDGQRVSFGPPGRLIVDVGFHERTAPSGLNPRRSLMENNQTAVQSFSLRSTLQAIQVNSGFAPDPELLYRQIIDSYASAANGKEPTAVHCGDETTNGAPTLNGYPIVCDRLEAQQIGNLGVWFATGAVNRIDLAPTDGAHCGQQRLIFANNAPIGNSRMFMILEAQIPNPHPECGVSACRPLADFWAKLSDVSDPAERGARLRAAFLTGDAELAQAGFPPFIDVQNLSVGTGSIRTNNFDDFEWTLRQFKVMSDGSGQTRAIPFPVADAAHGPLWNDTTSLPAGDLCRQSFLGAVDSLLSDDPAELAFPVNDACYDAESPNDFSTQNYPLHLRAGSGTFRNLLANRLAGTKLTPEDIATRAQFAGSCIGCHEEVNRVSLGNGVIAPSSNGFVQVDEEITENCGDGTQCFTASPALTQVFLPRRLRSLQALLDGASCSAPPDGGAPTDGGVTPPPPPVADAGVATPHPGADGGALPARAVLSPGESIADLVNQDQTEYDKLAGQKTLGGQPAQVTH